MRCHDCPCPAGLPCVGERPGEFPWACRFAAGNETERRHVLARSRQLAGLALSGAAPAEAPAAIAGESAPAVAPGLARVLDLMPKVARCAHRRTDPACGCGGMVRCLARGQDVANARCLDCVEEPGSPWKEADQPAGPAIIEGGEGGPADA